MAIRATLRIIDIVRINATVLTSGTVGVAKGEPEVGSGVADGVGGIGVGVGGGFVVGVGMVVGLLLIGSGGLHLLQGWYPLLTASFASANQTLFSGLMLET